MKKKNNKRLSINKIAHVYNSRSRACAKCLFNIHNPIHYIGIKQKVLDDICGQCSKSFIEGFKKGYKYKTISIKYKETKIIKHRGLFHPNSYNNITNNNRKYTKD